MDWSISEVSLLKGNIFAKDFPFSFYNQIFIRSDSSSSTLRHRGAKYIKWIIHHHGVSIEGLCCLTRLVGLYLVINVPLREFFPSTYISIWFTKMFGFSTYFFKKFIVPFSILFFHLSMLYYPYTINRCSKVRCWLQLS